MLSHKFSDAISVRLRVQESRFREEIKVVFNFVRLTTAGSVFKPLALTPTL